MLREKRRPCGGREGEETHGGGRNGAIDGGRLGDMGGMSGGRCSGHSGVQWRVGWFGESRKMMSKFEHYHKILAHPLVCGAEI
jgi:hypothetical protein